MKKKILLRISTILSLFWRIIPRKFRETFITGLLILESRGNAFEGIKQLFLVKDNLDLVINERALVLGDGVHPKHKLTKYHNFFIENIRNGENILDIGCGYGAVSKSIAKSKNKSQIIGIDYDNQKLDQAMVNNNYKNLKFINLDATKSIPKGNWEVVVLSNVLEHIKNRTSFIKKITKNSKCHKILIRVPLFERSWEIPMRKELGINYYSDNDHKIEHTLNQFRKEMAVSKVQIDKLHTIWGEIWAVCKVKRT